jgi:cytoskeletal protein CcmA (bactofilin family)
MTVQLSQVVNTQSFGVWLERTNQALSVISTNTVTTDVTINGALTSGNAFVNGVFGAVTLVANTLQGGNNVLANTLHVSTNVTINTTAFIGNSSANVFVGFNPLENTIINANANINSYLQSIIQNANGDLNATTDYIINADNATNNTNYLDLGINGSGYSNSLYSINGPLDGYLYSSNGALAIGTASAKPLQFFSNGTLSTNEVLRIDAGANVGIGNTNPNAKLQVTGTANVSDDFAMGNNLSVANTLSVGGNTTVGGFVNVVSTGQFGGNVSVNGAATFANSMAITGNTTISNSIAVTGNATLSNSMIVTGNVVFSNTLYVTGNVTFSNSLYITGSDTILNNLTVGNAVIFNANLSVNGAAVFTNSMAITGNTTISNTLYVVGNSTITSTANISGNTWIGSNLKIDGNLTVNGYIAFTANVAGNIIPQLDNYYTLGNTSFRWSIFASNGTFTNSISVSGSNSSFSTNLLFIDTTNSRVGVGTSTPSSIFTVNGMIESINSGIKFPDGSIQTTGAFPNGANSQIQFFDNTQTSKFNGNAALTYTVSSNTLNLNGTANLVNATVSNNISVSNTVIINNVGAVTSGSYTVSGTSPQTMDSYSASTYRAAEYLIQLSDPANPTNFHSSKVLVVHDGTSAYTTEFGYMYSIVAMATFSGDINGGNVRLRITPATGTVVSKYVRTAITV